MKFSDILSVAVRMVRVTIEVPNEHVNIYVPHTKLPPADTAKRHRRADDLLASWYSVIVLGTSDPTSANRPKVIPNVL